MSFNGNGYPESEGFDITNKGSIHTSSGSGNTAQAVSGNNGYVLSENSSQSNGLEWIANPSEIGFDNSVKGDIHSFSTTQAKIGVSGNNGYVLTEDSTTATGLAWATAGGGAWELMQVNDIGGGVAGSTQFGTSAFGVSGFDLDTVSCLKVYISGGNATSTVDFYAGVNNNFTGARYNYNYFYQDATVMTAVESINQNDFNLLNSNVLDAGAVSFWGEFTIMRDRDLTNYYQMYSQMYTATNGLQIGSCLMANASVGRIISSLEFKLSSGNYEALNASLYKLVNT